MQRSRRVLEPGRCIRILACETFSELLLNRRLVTQHTQAENFGSIGASFVKSFMETSLKILGSRAARMRLRPSKSKYKTNVTPSVRQSVLPSGLGKSVSPFTGARLAYFPLIPAVGQVASLQ